jgi:ligand-binding sensor domain-containing protein
MIRNWKIGCLLFCFFFLLSNEGFTQYKFDNANHISKEEGLPSNHVQVIKQCENGFIWMGTREGLCRYDGSQIKVYRGEKGKSNSLLYNRITDILAEDNRIWATTGVGLSVLDVYADTFVNYIYDRSGIRHESVPRSHLQMTAIYKDKMGDIWCGTRGNGFSKYNPSEDTFEFYKYEGIDHIKVLPNPEAVNEIISVHENHF